MSTNITPDAMIDLLSLMSVYDGRTNSREDVKGWLLIANLEEWDVAAVERVVIEHYRRGADRPRLSPPAVSDRLRQIRRAIAEAFESPVIPDDLPGRDYPAWYRAQMAAHVERGLAAWAATGEEPRRGAIDGNRYGSIADLVATAPDAAAAEIVGAYDRAMARRIPGPADFEAKRSQLP